MRTCTNRGTAPRNPVDVDAHTTRARRPPWRLPALALAWVAGLGALCSTLFLAAPAAAQPANGPASPWWRSPEAPPPEGEDAPINVRVRGGIGGGGGSMFLIGQTSIVQPSLYVSGRVGAQIGSVFSLYYQPTADIVVLTDGSGTFFANYNSFLADATIEDRVGIGFGPSADVLVVNGDGLSITKALFGLHGRLAIYLSRTIERTPPRRRGLSVGVDVHSTFAPGGNFLTLQTGLGYEWF